MHERAGLGFAAGVGLHQAIVAFNCFPSPCRVSRSRQSEEQLDSLAARDLTEGPTGWSPYIETALMNTGSAAGSLTIICDNTRRTKQDWLIIHLPAWQPAFVRVRGGHWGRARSRTQLQLAMATPPGSTCAVASRCSFRVDAARRGDGPGARRLRPPSAPAPAPSRGTTRRHQNQRAQSL